MQKFNRAVAIFLLLLLALAVAAAVIPAKGEVIFDKDSWMQVSAFPITMKPISLFRVDIDLEEALTEDFPCTWVRMFYIPERLEKVFLTDGYHLLEAGWSRSENGMFLSFNGEELKRLDGTFGLWLILTERTDE